MDAAFPEGSDVRHQLGETLVRLSGEDPRGWSRTALEAKVASAPPSGGDTIERARGFGPFGSGPGVVAKPLASPLPTAHSLEAASLASAAPSSPVVPPARAVPSPPVTTPPLTLESSAEPRADAATGSAKRAEAHPLEWSRVTAGITEPALLAKGAARAETRPARLDSDRVALEAALGGGTLIDVATARARATLPTPPAPPAPLVPSPSPVSVAPPGVVETAVRATGGPLLRTLADGLRSAGPAFAAKATARVAGSLSTLVQKALSARESLRTHAERDAVVRYGADLADEHVGALFTRLGAARQALGHPRSATALRAAIVTLRESAASARGDASSAAVELQHVVSRSSGTAVRLARQRFHAIGPPSGKPARGRTVTHNPAATPPHGRARRRAGCSRERNASRKAARRRGVRRGSREAAPQRIASEVGPSAKDEEPLWCRARCYTAQREAMSQVANPAVLTLEEAAAYLRLPPETVARQVSQGEIPGRHVGTEWRFLQSVLNEWLSTRDARQALLRHAGSFADDEALGELRAEAYRHRGRAETDPDPGA